MKNHVIIPVKFDGALRGEVLAAVEAAALPRWAPAGLVEPVPAYGGRPSLVMHYTDTVGTKQVELWFTRDALREVPEGYAPIVWNLSFDGRQIVASPAWDNSGYNAVEAGRYPDTATATPLPKVVVGELSDDPVTLPVPSWAFLSSDDGYVHVLGGVYLRRDARKLAQDFWAELNGCL